MNEQAGVTGETAQPGFLAKLSHWFNRFLDGTGWLGVILTFILMVMVFLDITLRYLISKTVPNAFEISTLLFGVTVLVVAGYVEKEGENINVQALTMRLSKRSQQILQLIVDIISVVFVGYLFYQFLGVVVGAYKSGETSLSVLWMPIWPYKASWLLGFLLLDLVIIRRIGSTIKAMRS